MQTSPWQIDGARASLAGRDATINIEKPSQGLADFAGTGSKVFATQPAGGGELVLADAYTRGADLVARYAPSDAFPFRTEIYWRCESASDSAPRVTLILSVETDLLDTRPELLVTSRIPGSLQADEGPGIVECGSDQLWFEAVHPTDRREAELSASNADGVTTLERRIFARFLEKGVIRRARLIGGLVDNAVAIDACYQQFAAEAPPLTA